MRIALDLDDVILDFVSNLVKIANLEYGTNLRAEDIVEWDLHKVLDDVVGENWWQWWRERDWLWAQADAVPGAIGGIRTLRREGHYLEILTSKPAWAEAQTFRWLGKWRPPVHRVTIVGPSDKKHEWSDAEILVDDKPKNVEEWIEAGRTAILFARPHNSDYRKTRIACPVAIDWTDVVDIITHMKEYQ